VVNIPANGQNHVVDAVVVVKSACPMLNETVSVLALKWNDTTKNVTVLFDRLGTVLKQNVSAAANVSVLVVSSNVEVLAFTATDIPPAAEFFLLLNVILPPLVSVPLLTNSFDIVPAVLVFVSACASVVMLTCCPEPSAQYSVVFAVVTGDVTFPEESIVLDGVC